MSGGYTGTVKLDINHNSFLGLKKMNLGLTYGITEYNLDGGCSGARIAFDYLGRPIKGDVSSMRSSYKAGTQRVIKSDCKIILTDDKEDNITIIVKAETGYIYIKR
jgi:hypothetical protein